MKKNLESNSTSEIDNQILRKTIFGVLSAGVAFGSFTVALQQVEIKANPKKIEVSYNF